MLVIFACMCVIMCDTDTEIKETGVLESYGYDYSTVVLLYDEITRGFSEETG